MRVQARFVPDTVRFDLGDGVAVPAEIEVKAEDVNGHEVDLAVVYDEGSGRYIARSVMVRAEDGSEVTGEGLRTIPVRTILRDGVMSTMQTMTLLSEGPPPSDLGKAGPTNETLRWVARVYRVALLLGDAPTQAVAAALDVPRSTAGRWVTRARDRGLLTVTDPRASRTE